MPAPRIVLEMEFPDEQTYRNDALRAEELDTAPWVKNKVTVNENAIDGPVGVPLAASEILEDGSAASEHFVTQTISTILGGGRQMSAWILASNRAWVRLKVRETAANNGFQCFFDLGNGVLGTSSTIGAGWSFDSANIEHWGGGWYRCTIKGGGTAGVDFDVQIHAAEGDGDVVFDGLTQSSLYVFGVMGIEQGSNPDFAWANPTIQYIKTTAAAVSHNYQVVAQTLGDASFVGDVLAPTGQAFQWSRGMPEAGPTDVTADVGQLAWVMDNGASNSGGKAGYYSPGHTDQRAGFINGIRARLRVQLRYVFNGETRHIDPSAGSGGRTTTCVAFDYMGNLDRFTDLQLDLKESQTGDVLITDVVDLLPRQPDRKSFDVGVSSFTCAFDDLGGRDRNALSVAHDINLSEGFGRLYVAGDYFSGETLRWENRSARNNLTTKALVLDQTNIFRDDDALEAPSATERIYNDVRVITHPCKIDAGTSDVVRLEKPIFVGAGDSVTIRFDFRDPNNIGELIGAKNVVTPVANTDWTANSAEGGGGTDQTGDWTVAMTARGSKAEFVISNNGAASGYLRGESGNDGMRARGQAIRRFAPVESQTRDTVSITTFDVEKSIEIDMPYQDDSNSGKSTADLVIQLFSSVGNQPLRVRVLTEVEAYLNAVGHWEIGEQVQVVEPQTGVSHTLVIQSIDSEIGGAGNVALWLGLTTVDPTQAKILDDAVFGQLDNYALGY